MEAVTGQGKYKWYFFMEKRHNNTIIMKICDPVAKFDYTEIEQINKKKKSVFEARKEYNGVPNQ